VASSLALSCAGPNKLAQQSEKAYSQGELQKAYQKAASALRKDPENQRARAAMTQVASKLMDERMTEIRGLAARDTVAAANRSLELDKLRDELAGYRIVLPPDPAFDRDDAAIRHGAAGIEYAQAVEDLGAGAPKRAYDEFQTAQQFQPRYRDVAHRIQQAYDQAQPRVAFFPFANETDLGALSKGFADRAYAELSRRIASSDFRFTELIPSGRVYEALPVAMLDQVSPRQAARIGRDLGVDRVIVGRFYGLRTTTNVGAFTQTVYHKIVDKDDKGAERERYTEGTMAVVTRDRELSVGYEYSIVSVEDGTVHVSVEDSAGLEGDVVESGFGSGHRSRYRPLLWTAQDLLVLLASLAAIVAIAVLPGVPYNPYLELVPSVPNPDQWLAVGLLAVPALTASVLRVDHAAHHA